MDSMYEESIKNLTEGKINGHMSFNDFIYAYKTYKRARENNAYIYLYNYQFIKYLDNLYAIDILRDVIFKNGYIVATLYFDDIVEYIKSLFKVLEGTNTLKGIKTINNMLKYYINELNKMYSEFINKTPLFVKTYNKYINEIYKDHPEVVGDNDFRIPIDKNKKIINFKNDNEKKNTDNLLKDGWLKKRIKDTTYKKLTLTNWDFKL